VNHAKAEVAKRMNLLLLCERKVRMEQDVRREAGQVEWTADEASARVTTLYISADRDKLWQNLPPNAIHDLL
jgi:hypothetical protein